MHRTLRGFVAVVATLAAVLTTAGCSADGGGGGDPAQWARGQEYVASAEMVSWDDPADGTFLFVTLEQDLPDDTVRSVAQGFKKHFDDETDRPSIEVDVDGFQGSVYPGLPGDRDVELERALWLRADGRATSYGDQFHSTTGTHRRVIAPAAEVAQLALDYDNAVSHEKDVRQTKSVESADGSTGVQWAAADRLGFYLDSTVVGEFARLQKAYPGTTGWVDSSGGATWKAFVDFDPTEVTLAQVASGSLVDASKFADLQLGWGPARAEAGRFAAVFGDPATRRLLDDLGGIAGVSRIGEEGVEVRNGRALAQVQAYLTRSGQDVKVSLQRAPVLYDFPTEPVLTTRSDNSAPIRAAYTAVADLPGIARLALSTNSRFGNLTVDDEVTPAELQKVFAALLALPAPYVETDVFAEVPGDYGRDSQIGLGKAVTTGFTRAEGVVAAYPDLLARVEQAWKDARAR